MTGTEKELLTLKEELESLLSADYQSKPFENDHYKGEVMFIISDARVIHIDMIIEYKCLLVEFAQSENEAENLTLEDGSLYYPEDYQDKNDMFREMLNEITG